MTAGLAIVGGSYGAAHAIAAARRAGYGEPITMITADTVLPYERPPLSKAAPVAVEPPGPDLIKPARFYAENEVEVLLGTFATGLDGRAVELDSGCRIGFDRLLVATGATARGLPVPGTGLAGLVTLRTLSDAVALRESLSGVADVVIIGAGFIGLEVASALAGSGRTVTVIEAADRLLGRSVSAATAEALHRRHAEQGTRLLLGTGVTGFVGSGGRVRGVRCGDGTVLGAGVALVAVGSAPAGTLGLGGPDGVPVDASQRAERPGVLSVGDCARHPNRFATGPVRLESVQNAVDQARVAGTVLAGRPATYDATPWFWSDQAGVRLQIAGLLRPGLTAVTRGDPDGPHSVLHLDEAGHLVAAESVDRGGDHVQARTLVGRGAVLDAVAVTDPGLPLRDAVLAAAAVPS